MILGTNEILASKHYIAQSQTRVLWDCHLCSSQIFCLLLLLKVFRNTRFKYLSDSNAECIDAAFKGFIFFIWVLLQDVYDLQYGSKVNWQSVAGLDYHLDSRLEQVIENQVEDRVSRVRKQKIYPWLLFCSYVDIFVKTVLPIQWYSSKRGEFVIFATRICWGKTLEKPCF